MPTTQNKFLSVTGPVIKFKDDNMLIKKGTIKSKDIIWRKFIGYLMKTLIRYFCICNQSCNQFLRLIKKIKKCEILIFIEV